MSSNTIASVMTFVVSGIGFFFEMDNEDFRPVRLIWNFITIGLSALLVGFVVQAFLDARKKREKNGMGLGN